jgi:sec-independent protein translocase protein TatC
MQIASFFGLVLASPVVIAQVWGFIAPGLYQSRSALRVPFILLTALAFAGGVAFSYYLVLPVTIPVLLGFLGDAAQGFLSIGRYIGNVLMLMAVFGLMFELPVLAFLLARIGILRAAMLRRTRRYAIVVLLIGAAAISPTGDPFNFALVAVPLLVLYELSILVVAASRAPRRGPEPDPPPTPSRPPPEPRGATPGGRRPPAAARPEEPMDERIDRPARAHRRPEPRAARGCSRARRGRRGDRPPADRAGRSHYDPVREQAMLDALVTGEPRSVLGRHRQEPVQAGLPGVDAARAGAGQDAVPDLAPPPREDTVVWVATSRSAATTRRPDRRSLRDRVARAGHGDRRPRRGARRPLFRGGAYKPRTDPYSFQGLGEEGWRSAARPATRTASASSPSSWTPPTCRLRAHVDVIQIGARNMQNFRLLKAAGRSRCPCC